jgi:hypothetical protein
VEEERESVDERGWRKGCTCVSLCESRAKERERERERVESRLTFAFKHLVNQNNNFRTSPRKAKSRERGREGVSVREGDAGG